MSTEMLIDAATGVANVAVAANVADVAAAIGGAIFARVVTVVGAGVRGGAVVATDAKRSALAPLPPSFPLLSLPCHGLTKGRLRVIVFVSGRGMRIKHIALFAVSIAVAASAVTRKTSVEK